MTSRQESSHNYFLQIGDSKLSEENGKICVPPDLYGKVTDFKSSTENIYPGFDSLCIKEVSWLREMLFLTPRNDIISSINDTILEKLPTLMARYTAVDCGTGAGHCSLIQDIGNPEHTQT